MGGGGCAGCCRVLVTLSVLVGLFSGCTTQEGDVNVVLPGADGSVPAGECVPGAETSCGLGIGACVPGVTVCTPEGEWDTCVLAGSPRDEVCDGVDNDCDGQIDEHIDCMCSDEIEICEDRRDNNCNGVVDEGCSCDPGVTEPCITDLPGACALGTMRCRPDGVSFTECLPSAASSLETCDGIDNDCDGIADEDVCECSAGSARGCTTSLPGACAAGSQTCNPSGRGFGPCMPATTESLEICGDGSDNDCDGTADEGCECTSGISRPCVSPLPGECASGIQTCTASVWGHCIPDMGANPETCNGLDDDCDGIADEEVCSCLSGDIRTCHSGLSGACDIGEQRCSADGRSYGTCLSLNVPSAERCNGVDDDCDGVADDDGVCSCTPGATRSCLSGGSGVCSIGTQTCIAGGRGYSPCLPTSGPGSEVCDGLDNDCDGIADEEVCACTPLSTRACPSGSFGQCAAGTQTCASDGRGWNPCLSTSGPTSETCDGIDNDCDGEADEEVCTCTPFEIRLCLTMQPGMCSYGIQECRSDGRYFDECIPYFYPFFPYIDECGNGLDEDCDGTADEGCDCTAGTVLPCLSNLFGRCSAGTRTCTADGRMYGACIPSSGSTAETCNGVDDDCDGVADEEVCACTPFSTRACPSGIGGVCAAGLQTCSGDGRGYSPCLPTTTPSPDVCADGIDNDCDDTADEGCDCAPGASRTCVTTLPGACSVGSQACTDGLEWGPCTPTVTPLTETCDGLDNDCDGTADEEVCACTPFAPRACATSLPGSCSAGIQTCAGDGRGWNACIPSLTPTVDICGDGVDSDCDGSADEGCSCTAGASQSCLTGLFGACSSGSQICNAGRTWSPCLPSAGPSSEICNGIDDDCDGNADDDGVCTCTVGASASCLTDLAGVCAGGTMTCVSGGRGFTACLPGAAGSPEVCNGLDDDCDGTADEDVCTCPAGLVRACNSGQPGSCLAGTQTCDSDGRGWGACLSSFVRTADICGDGLDTDCDGTTDEGCVCTSGTNRPCTSGLDGVCSAGLQACTGGRWDVCIPTGVASLEVCNGRDDDCDGVADEDVCTCTPLVARACVTSLPGVCSAGTQLCDADGRGFGPCTPTSAPSSDVCTDGFDNDCDGEADEGCSCTPGVIRTCDTERLGVCANGTQTCDAGRSWSPCLPSAGPSSETCDGSDNDCDGVADEEVCTCIAGLTRACVSSLPGVCAAGLQTCDPMGRGWGSCLPTMAPSVDVCADGADNDCDGLADEGCTCTAGATRSCLTGQSGVCSAGLQTCAAGLTWNPCLPTIAPSSETCNGVDDDCDGPADEDVCICAFGASAGCLTGLTGVCSAGIMTCTAGGRGYTACLPTVPSTGETCNGLDDDCDGVADEEVCSCVPGLTEACSTGLAGACGAGTHTCRSDGRGYGPCVGTMGSTSETCDGVDNDCDGNADEEVCTCIGGTPRGCPTGLPGVCSAGTQACDADGRGWSHCTSLTGPSADLCTDGLDNDCDGTADEGCICTSGAIRACTTGLDGACSTGTQTCDAGMSWTPCIPTVAPLPETCPGDGIDSDCDGTADEGCRCAPGLPESCLTGLLGLCTMGSMTCRPDGRSFTACLPVAGPVSEIPSNGTDDDCNGVTDDVAACASGTVINCATGLTGICARGESTCLPSGSGYGPCVLLTGGNPEVCGNAIDDSCNGMVDETCVACTAGAGLSCSTGMPGVCAAGTTTCFADGSGFGPCSPSTFGSAEVCNGLDDDCNGVIDNGVCP